MYRLFMTTWNVFLHAGRVRSEFTASVNFNPAFRELEWQDLHAAALQLLGHSIQALLLGSHTGETSAKIAAVWKVCRLFCPCCILSKAKNRKRFYSHREKPCFKTCLLTSLVKTPEHRQFLLLTASSMQQILEKEAVWCDHRQMAILGSRIVDPDVSWGPQYQNLLRGTEPYAVYIKHILSRMQCPPLKASLRSEDLHMLIPIK